MERFLELLEALNATLQEFADTTDAIIQEFTHEMLIEEEEEYDEP